MELASAASSQNLINPSSAMIPVEEQFRIMADTAPVLIWIADSHKLFYFFNQEWLKFTGKSMQEEYGNGWTEGVHPDDLKRCLDVFSNSFDSRQEFKMEYRLKRFDGVYRWLLHNGVPRYTSDKTFAGYIGSCVDVTDLKESEKRKDEFISVASHELKTPITTMKVYLHILEDYFEKNLDEKHMEFAAKAQNQVTKLSKLINNLLDLSRIEGENLEFDVQTIPYCEMVHEMAEHFQSITPSHKIEVIGNCNAKVKGDKERLSQAFFNLLSNAVKYSSAKDKVVIELSQSDKYITTTVKDFGIGISSKHHGKIFDKFYRVNEIKKQTFPGLGIGLYITSEIIKRHGGNIWVTSEEGNETSFIFELPIYEK